MGGKRWDRPDWTKGKSRIAGKKESKSMASTVVHKPKGDIKSIRDTKRQSYEHLSQPPSLRVRELRPLLLKVVVDLFIHVRVPSRIL